MAFSVAPIESAFPWQLWCLAWGQTIGDTRARVKLRLYAFAGFSGMTVWQRDDLRGGMVTVSRGRVVLEYYQPRPYGVLSVSEQRIRELLRPRSTGWRAG
jgi:hypothetical protein